jgi:endonuclease/exonuclease/phosphatase family metal-dependent hydrolase
MRILRTTLGLAAFLTACAGGATPAPAPHAIRATCRPAAAPVTWVAAPAPAERAEQDAWCAAVGEPVVFNASPEPPRLDSLLVVTWNVKVGGGDVQELVERVRRGVVTGGTPVEHFALLLQEAHRSGGTVPERVAGTRVPRGIVAQPPDGRRTAIDDVAHSLGLSLAYVPSMRNGARTGANGREDRGNAIVTTLPLRDVVAIELPLVRQRRVTVAATVTGRTTTGEPWALQLASVHLENRPARGVTGIREREQQMARLLAVLPAATLSVIGGDLNAWAGGEREPAVTLALLHYPDTGATPGGVTFDGPAFFNGRLDYLFARLPGGRLSGYSRSAQRYGSDHHPVLAWVHPPVTESELEAPPPIRVP